MSRHALGTFALPLLVLAFSALGIVTGDSRAASAQEPPVIHVAVSAFEAHADAYYALELGLFKRAGLNVDVQQFQGGESIVAGIFAGALQIGAGNPLPLASAHERGLDVVIIAPGNVSDATLRPIGGLLVAANSPLRSGKDLNGKIVAVNTLHSVDQIAVETWVDKNGGDSRTVKFLEIPNIVMVDAAAAGRVDAALVADPGYSTGLESGKVRVLADANEAIAKQFMASAWFSSRDWADHNPDAVRKFAAAINEASAWAVKNPEAAAAVLRKYLHLTTSRAHEQHASKLDPALLQPLIDAAVHYGRLAKPLDVRDIIWHETGAK
jgi:NitT/TauT family transport system substrate-binding protein